MVESITSNIQLLIAFNSTLLALWLVWQRFSGREGSIFLLGVFLAFSMQMLGNYQFSTSQGGVFALLRFGTGLLYGPLIYFYLRSLIHNDRKFEYWEFSHFSPAVISVAVATWGGLSNHIYAGSIFFSLAVYLIASWRMILTARAKNQLAVSARVSWIFVILTFASAILVINIVAYVVEVRELHAVSGLTNLALFAAVLATVTAFLLIGLSSGGLNSLGALTRRQKAVSASALAPEETQQILKKLTEHLLQEKPFLKPNASLTDIATQIGVSPRKVSRVINTELKTNFPNLINGYRVREAQSLLSDPHKSGTHVLNIGFDVGFNSKASFNRVFKTIVGISPTDYRQSATGMSDT